MEQQRFWSNPATQTVWQWSKWTWIETCATRSTATSLQVFVRSCYWNCNLASAVRFLHSKYTGYHLYELGEVL